MICGLKGMKPFKTDNMKNDQVMDFPFSRFLSPLSSLNEITTGNDFEKFCKVREEMNEFLKSLNRSGLSEALPDQIHYLYVALIHIENVEKEIMSCSLSEEILSQSKIVDDINCLKMMVVDYIQDLSGCIIE
jgi:hypothetical protein